MKFPGVDKLSLTSITDNYCDSLGPVPPFAKRYRAIPNASIHAEHGLSWHVEVVIGGRAKEFIFDYGLDSPGIIRNMDFLGIDMGKVMALGLSHGHFDHWGGLMGLLRHNASKIMRGTPLYVGEEVFAHRYSLRSTDLEPQDLGWLERDYLDRLGIVKAVEIKDPTEVIPGGYLTGNIEKVTDYEKGSPSLLIERDGRLEQDRFEGEQAFVCNVKDKGLVILSGCAHVGIVNTVKHAQKITGIQKVHAVIGGFHLANADSTTIQKTLADVKETGPDHIIPAHCTGLAAVRRFADAMEKEFTLNAAGTKYVFGTQEK
jgi:7,8-dihydropterin-6-yl-methyl-4-(beta-D-ribofuranosyl)aminobenzene 5'-phosphate synthase